jgi:hypothetical protein
VARPRTQWPLSAAAFAVVFEAPFQVALKWALVFESIASIRSDPLKGAAVAMRSVGFSLHEMPVCASKSIWPP